MLCSTVVELDYCPTRWKNVNKWGMKLDEADTNCTDTEVGKTLCRYRPNVSNVEKENGGPIFLLDSWSVKCKNIDLQATQVRQPDWRYIEMLIPKGSGCPQSWKNYNQRREEIRPISDVVDICAEDATEMANYQLCSYWINLENLVDGAKTRKNRMIRSLNGWVARDVECNADGLITCSEAENPDVAADEE